MIIQVTTEAVCPALVLENGGIIFSFVGQPLSGSIGPPGADGIAACRGLPGSGHKPTCFHSMEADLHSRANTPRLEPVDVLAQALSRPAIVPAV